MKKKRIIAWSIAIGVLVSLILIVCTVFTLSSVDFQRTAMLKDASRSRLFTSATTETLENNMYESAKFNKGGNLLFMSFDKNVENIEIEHPYVKIEKVVRKFPNKVTVYYSEREAVALVPVQNVENAYFVVDNELKVLDYVSEQNNTYKLPVIDYYGKAYSAAVGTKINDNSLKSNLATFVSSVFSANGIREALYEDVMGKVYDIKFSQEYYSNNANPQFESGYFLKCEFSMYADEEKTKKATFEVWKVNSLLFQKIANAYDVFETIISQEITTAGASVIVHETIINGQQKVVVVNEATNESYN